MRNIMGRLPLQSLLLLLLQLLVSCSLLCLAQQVQPLSGNRLSMLDENLLNETYSGARWWRQAPDGEYVPKDMDVYVSAFVERLFDVNVDRYTHDIGMRLMLSWADPSFSMLVDKATTRWMETGECERFCSLISPQCCDEVYLPGALLVNVDELPEGRMHDETFNLVDELTDIYDGIVDGSVLWAINVHGTFHSDFNFGRFPNDRQRLKIVFRAESCGYIFHESATGKGFSWEGQRPQKNKKTTTGDDTSGWEIENVSVKSWYAPYTNLYVKSKVNDPADPFFEPTGILQDKSSEEILEDYEFCEKYYDQPGVCGAMCSHGFTITITVKRYATYFGWNTIFPVVVIVICSLLTYFIDPKMIELRLSSIIALILALTALQFVIQEFLPDSSYLTPVAQMIVCGYWIMLVEALETVFVFWMVEYKVTYMEHMREKEKERSQREMEVDKMAFEDVEGSMIRAQSEVRRRTSQPAHADSFADGNRDDDAEDVLHSFRLKQFGKTSSKASYHSRPDDLPAAAFASEEDAVQQRQQDAYVDDDNDEGVASEEPSFSSITKTLAKSTRVFTSFNRHRRTFLSQKSEYKVALMVDLLFLILSAIGFTVSTILFFVLDKGS